MHYAVFDIDGTISQAGRPITELMAEALLIARQRYQVVFASARPVRDMLPLLPDALHDALMVGCNGGMAWQSGMFLFNDKFAPKTGNAIVTWLDDRQAPYVAESHWHYAFSPMPHAFHHYIRGLNAEHAPISPSVIKSEGLNKILILDVTLRNEVLDFIKTEGLDVVEKLHRQDACFDLMPSHTDKVNALDRLAIAPEKAVIFGNDVNDQAMLARAGYSVVVGDFEPEIPPHQRISFERVPHAIKAFAAV